MAGTEHKTLSRGTKYYRVILSGIDPRKETQDTFALKLSMQTRAPITRIRSIVQNLPAPVKSGLDMGQARRFSAVVEELGGETRIESYVLRPGESHSSRAGQGKRGHLRTARNGNDAESATDLQGGGGGGRVCFFCGWENCEDAHHCEFCHARFDRCESPDPLLLQKRGPEENPLAEAKSSGRDITLWDFIAQHKIAFLIGLNVLLLLVIIFRR